MESEKVKKIKEGLECCTDPVYCDKKCPYSIYDRNLDCINKLTQDTLTLINELESENESLKTVFDIANERTYRKKFIEKWRKEYQKQLDKQGKGHIAGFPDFDLVYKLYFEQKDRLAELEDKIENGTLVTVPYSIGQDLYCVDNKSYKVEKVKVSLIVIRHDGGIDIRLNHYYKDGSYCGCFKYDSKYYKLFKTETEALKKIEELKRST